MSVIAESNPVINISARNRQRRYPINRKVFVRLLHEFLTRRFSKFDWDLHFEVVGPQSMAAVNLDYVGHEGPTDVITFNYSNDPQLIQERADQAKGGSSSWIHGEIFICPQVAEEQAKLFGSDWKEEVFRYAVHGILHLLGWDDLEPKARRAMKIKENAEMRWCLKHLAIQDIGGTPQGY